jgi:hypothetical protein
MADEGNAPSPSDVAAENVKRSTFKLGYLDSVVTAPKFSGMDFHANGPSTAAASADISTNNTGGSAAVANGLDIAKQNI